MFRSTIFASAIFAMIALVSAAPSGHEDGKHDGKKHKDVHTGGNAGLVNVNPGKHLLIDDIVLKHALNHVIDLDLIKLEEILKNVDILSGNGAHHIDDQHHEHYEEHHDEENHYDGEDDEDC